MTASDGWLSVAAATRTRCACSVVNAQVMTAREASVMYPWPVASVRSQ